MENALLEVAKKFNKDTISVELLAKCRNAIYKAKCIDYSFVLRLSDEQHRNVKEIESELDFQKYLFDNGANVAKPLQTESSESSVMFEFNNSRYIVSAFEFVDGKDWSERSDDSEEMYIKVGQTLGKIHKLSKGYTPVNVKRRLWNEQQELLKADVLFKSYNMKLYDKFVEFMGQMEKEDKTPDNFGLTHGDYLISNYLLCENNRLTVIDFDECEYSWFAADLAICMRCYLFWTEKPEELPLKAKEAEIMHYNLLLGYSLENAINKEMVFDLEKYIKIRDFIELAQYIPLMRDNYELNDIEKKLIDMCLDRILNNRPFLKFNTSKAEKLLL